MTRIWALASFTHDASAHFPITDGNFSASVDLGSGIWILEMAQDYPKSKFVGVDAAAVYPSRADLRVRLRVPAVRAAGVHATGLSDRRRGVHVCAQARWVARDV
ncbi:hypothetical protein BC938DRAFT_475629 [Jimgerdemannia flammicorona]|uniref:Methyltransferase domain-containing protein n=1 Tax=Jimgerdemannia flammicorona TaxID=994334 RepID=A0A433QRF7_9FUNG|nr:hypothetical protein BC938DRAFT_475629 [Jimgerdemannia flammicorona]